MLRHQGPSTQQRGVALITALLVVALASVAAVSLTSSHQLDMRRAQTSQNFGQAQLHAASLEALAAEMLLEIGVDEEMALEQLDDDCRTQPLSFEIDGAGVQARLEDLHCRINLNNLLDAEDEETEQAFISLVDALNREYGEVSLDAADLIDALRAWADPEVEEDWYSRQDPPYRPGNRRLASAGELVMVRGMTAEAYQALSRYVTALPAQGTRFNAFLAPERLREAYDLPPPAEMDPDEYGLGDYAQLEVLIEQDDRLYQQCSMIHIPSGDIVMRRLRGCDG
ncbi:hypothetical protein CKO08_01315 [Halorhodospira halochloris]|nr:type II secretion system minor pseudopilin GspK [Halorhodospira halochloris]MBK1650882.1 hypothetical protein [Halorhodospira halochloris]